MANRSDNFNRLGSLHGSTPSDGGAAWTDATAGGPVFATADNPGFGEYIAYENTWTGHNFAYLDCGSADHEITAEIIRIDKSAGVVARVTDADNCYYFGYDVGGTSLHKRIAGSWTLLATGSASFSPGLGQTISLRCVGSTISGYVNGVMDVSVTDTTHSSQTKAGFRTDDHYHFFNSMSITDLAGGGGSVAPIAMNHFRRLRQ